MSKKKNLLILAGSIAGGIIYSLFVTFFDYFTPITGMLAGFAGCIYLSASIGEKKDHTNKSVLMFLGISILSLLIGYVSLYYIKAQIVHGTTFYLSDIMTFNEFIKINLGFPDIFSAILGGLTAYGLSDIITTSVKGISSFLTREGKKK